MEQGTTGFVLPHLWYWLGLLLSPLLFLFFATKQRFLVINKIIDYITDKVGIFVALWVINAVLIYSYEVIMRKIYNQPTIWVHEAAFLMLGMQYLLAGAYALLHNAHVRVDILFNILSPRAQAALDVLTSVFMFIFVLALVGSSVSFFWSSFQMKEITVETWGIQHWPVKGMLLLGSILLLLQAISKFIKDIRRLFSLSDLELNSSHANNSETV